MQPTTKRGRPSKGDRRVIWARVPVDLAARVFNDAEQNEMTYSDTVANIIAAHYGHESVAKPPARGQMKLTA